MSIMFMMFEYCSQVEIALLDYSQHLSLMHDIVQVSLHRLSGTLKLGVAWQQLRQYTAKFRIMLYPTSTVIINH